MFDSEIWENIHLCRFFIYLVGNAVFAEKGVKKGDVLVKKGQYLRSYRNIRKDLKYIENNSEKYYSLSHIKKMVDTLTENTMISTKPETLGTLFTIINYTKYQDLEGKKEKEIQRLRTEKEQLENRLRTERERRENNNKNVKNVKNVKELSTYADEIKEIYDYWIGLLSDVNNAKFTQATKEKILTKLKLWNKEKILQAINNYHEIYRSDYYYSHNWTLRKIIEQGNGLPRFLPGLDEKYDGDIWKDYQKNNSANRNSMLSEIYSELKEEENEKNL
jgi:predicted  nucleic acid-binding Zn-ribbon protein